MFSAVNSVCWGPYDFGLILACGSSDGAISLLTFTGDQQWDVKKINNAHTVIYGEHICGRDSVWSLADLFSPFLHRSLQIGCNAVSWAPAVLPGSLIDQPTSQKPNYVKRFVSGGCDNLVKLWKWVCTLLLFPFFFFFLYFPSCSSFLFFFLCSSSLFALLTFTGSCLYVTREEDGQWKEDQKLEAHSDWVRDVGWAPSIGLPTSTIASCSQVRFYLFR